MFWATLLMSPFVLVVVQSSEQCKTTYSKRGRYLRGHVILSENLEDIGKCYVKCLKDHRCKSINFHFDELLCELNDADRYTHPWDYVIKKNHAYNDYPAKVSFKNYIMAPSWLKEHASYISSNHNIANDQITFSAGSIMDEALLKDPLVAAGVLEDGTPLTIEIAVANDVTIGQTKDSDIRYGVSDGTNFIGFETVDKFNYGDLSPCFGAEGKSGETLTEIQRFGLEGFISLPNKKFYPDQFVVTLKVGWMGSSGLCFTPHDGGFFKTAEYMNQLLPSHGLSLEVYKSHARECVGIKYISITVKVNDG